MSVNNSNGGILEDDRKLATGFNKAQNPETRTNLLEQAGIFHPSSCQEFAKQEEPLASERTSDLRMELAVKDGFLTSCCQV